MPDPAGKLTPADPRDLADAIAFALRYSGGNRVRDADEVVSTIAARRIVEHLRGARYRVMKRHLAERDARRELAADLSMSVATSPLAPPTVTSPPLCVSVLVFSNVVVPADREIRDGGRSLGVQDVRTARRRLSEIIDAGQREIAARQVQRRSRPTRTSPHRSGSRPKRRGFELPRRSN
jgi:hypothetical protein